MLRFLSIALLGLVFSCASSKQAVPSQTGANLNKLYAERWFLSTEHLAKDYVDKGQNAKLDVQYDTYYSFSEGKMVKTTVCHFKNPVQKTLIVDTEAPVLFAGNTLRVLMQSTQKQDYNVTLAPRDKKGPNIKRSVFCSSTIEPKTYTYEIKGDELILKPVEEILRLKKYKQN